MTNYSNNAVKSHEKSLNKGNNAESVNNILDNVENTPFALRGSLVKTILYSLFSLIAAAELTAALTFYTVSMGVSVIVAAVVCGLLAFGFHGLLHAILSDTAKGIVFGKTKESGAMANEVKTNIVLSVFLLGVASCSVFFIGKKGFTAYRATEYEKKAEAAKAPPTKQLDPSVLAGKNGKIAAWKIEALTDLENAKAKNITATTAKDESNQARYDATTATITDIVGASAFLIELLLALLAYSIATAKLAAVREELARRNGHATQQTTTKTAENVANVATTQNVTENVTQTVENVGNVGNVATTQPVTQQKHEKKWSEFEKKIQNRIIELWVNENETGLKMDIECLEMALNIVNPVVLITSSGINFSQDIFKAYELCESRKVRQPVKVIEPETPQPIAPEFGFSQNKTDVKEGNEGRVVIKGFQRYSKPQTETTIEEPLKDSKKRLCAYCEKEFEFGSVRKRFCSDACRGHAWEEKTGTKLRKKAKA